VSANMPDAPRVIVAGASRGIGAAVAGHMADRASRLVSISRTPSAHGEWVSADLATEEGITAVVDAWGAEPLDALLYMGGTWEAEAFSDSYRFETSPPDEIRRVVAVNLTAPILLTQRLLPALRQAPNPRVIVIGALIGVDGDVRPEVANTASKAGLRGMVHAMRAALAVERIGISVIDPANVATDEVIEDIAEGRFAPQTPIPMADLLAAVDFILALSDASTVPQLPLAQTDPGRPTRSAA